MNRKKLLSKKENTKKTNPLKKKLQEKITETNIKDLFSAEFIYTSNTIVTDNNCIALIVPDSEEFLIKHKLQHKVNSFNLEEDHFQIEFNRNEPLEICEVDENDIYAIPPVGTITGVQYNWLKQNYPSCVFHQITKWFGKKVNTLVIVLAEEFGKPVAIVKTIE